MQGAGEVCAQRKPFQHYGQEDGLRNLAVYDLAQDWRGYLWVATENGLFRYNGMRFEEYGKAEGLPHSYVIDVCISGDEVWAATAGGLAYREGERFRELALPESPALQPGKVLSCDAGGLAYVSTMAGVFEIRGRKREVRAVPPPEDRSLRAAHGVKSMPGGEVWYGCGRDLCVYDPARGRTEVAGRRLGLPEDQWDAVVTDQRGHLWMRSRTRMVELDAKAGVWWRRDRGLPQSSRVGMLRAFRTGAVMAATDEGLAAWNGSGWEIQDERHGLRSNMVSTVFRDREGSLWIGYAGGGLSRMRGFGQWTEWSKADGLPDSVVWEIERDAQGVLWAGTTGGVGRLREDGRFESLEAALGWPRRNARALAVAADGSLWVGYSPGGVARIDPARRKGRLFGERDGIAGDAVMALETGVDGTVWVATRTGLFRSRGVGRGLRFEAVGIPGFPEAGRFVGLLRDAEGSMWVAGRYGLARFRDGEWRVFGGRDGLRSEFVGSVAQDRAGAYWIGYRENAGLTRMTFGEGGRPRFTHFTERDGLASGLSMLVGVDAQGWIWYGSDRGVDVWDGNAWRHYGHADGLAWEDTDGNSFWADADGSVWIGTSQGLSRFRRAARARTAPPVSIERFRAGGETLALKAEGLEAPERPVEIEYAALVFHNPKAVRFRYRLSGLFEGRWEETEERRLRYPKLPPGNYRFEVAARSPEGVWSETPAALSFTVLPVWWKSGWFLTLVAAGLGYGLVWGYRWRVDALKRARRELERAVAERTRELEEATRAKGEFLAHMSHEIRTPLNGIVGITQLLRGMGLEGEARELVELSHASSQALVEILNGILDFSKLEAGKMELERAPYSPREVAGESARMLMTLAREKGLELRWEVSGEVPELAMGDATRLRQVLLNLLGNAVKFTSEGMVSLSVSRRDGMIEYAVADTGAGIPAEKLAVIFEPFTQADSSMTRRYGGTGLGLAISRQLAERMGGRIEVESELGRGSVFRVFLPLEEAGAEAPEEAGARTEEARRALRILVAEDNPVNQLLARKLLETRGHDVDVVSDGRRAVEAVGAGGYDLVLMDVQMPEMDGYEAARRIRANGGRLPIVAMTANAMEGDRERCLESGMDGYLSKPVSVEALAALIGSVERGGYREAVQARKSPSGSTSAQ
jgi:signal transduction histidine kinase/CheY-like chemotaxis protein/ligand-binding sensor domain-containing protein